MWMGSKNNFWQNIEEFESRVFDMGQNYPKLSTALQQMRYEI